jgi:hypothetical protein
VRKGRNLHAEGGTKGWLAALINVIEAYALVEPLLMLKAKRPLSSNEQNFS